MEKWDTSLALWSWSDARHKLPTPAVYVKWIRMILIEHIFPLMPFDPRSSTRLGIGRMSHRYLLWEFKERRILNLGSNSGKPHHVSSPSAVCILLSASCHPQPLIYSILLVSILTSDPMLFVRISTDTALYVFSGR